MYTLPRHGMRHLGRIDEPSISCDQDILYGKKEFVAKPSEKKMMMKRKMRRLEAKPEHESRSIQRVSSRCKWTNNYQYLMYKFILAICNPIRCFENSTCIKVMPILNEKFFLHALFLRYYLTCDSLYWLFIIDFKGYLWYIAFQFLFNIDYFEIISIHIHYCRVIITG